MYKIKDIETAINVLEEFEKECGEQIKNGELSPKGSVDSQKWEHRRECVDELLYVLQKKCDKYKNLRQI